jgi:TetR/AcrR family transcriptional regulator, transcriptional repressor for nem operon
MMTVMRIMRGTLTVTRTAPRGKKETTHERMVEVAARAIRRSGYDGMGSDIMKEAGPTHSGFYAHFPSREALLVEAADRAGEDSHPCSVLTCPGGIWKISKWAAWFLP